MEFNTTLVINDRLYDDITNYCRVNNIDMKEYLVELIEAQHMINKYGDLNEIIPKKIEESTVVVKKRGRPKKKVENEEVNLTKNDEIPSIKTLDEYVKDVESEKVETEQQIITEETKPKPTVKRKRTLKTL